MEIEPAPREKKIRRGIVLLSSLQVALGAVIIAMSFTAFASTSSAKIRAASPYWAGFMVLFTGSVGFLTWKQLSIVSIGIYTFLSTASVIVCLVATVLSGDSAGLLKTLAYCVEVKFEHACQCCVTNSTCLTPYKFPSVRNCGIVHGFLKDVMYSLCVVNIVCCVICLTVTIVGCTLGAQYSRYSQSCSFRWSRPPAQAEYDHRYNWSPFPIDQISNLPPWAPPIYYPVPNTPTGVNYQCRRAPTVFDPVDFPPPYTSREPSIAGRYGSRASLGVVYSLSEHGISWDQLGPSVFRFFGQGTAGTVSEDSFEYIDRTNVRDLGSSSSTSEGMATHNSGAPDFGRNVEEFISQSGQSISQVREMLPSSSTESESESHDNVFTSRELCTMNSKPGTMHGSRRTQSANDNHGNSPRDNNERDVLRRHSWAQQSREAQSRYEYSAHDEIHHTCIAPNVNSWARSLSENEAQARKSPITKQRANSTPCYPGDHVTKRLVTSSTVRSTSGIPEACHLNPEVIESSLFGHFTEGKPTRTIAHKKRRRPRNNPGHILEQDSEGKEVALQDGPDSEYRETTL